MARRPIDRRRGPGAWVAPLSTHDERPTGLGACGAFIWREVGYGSVSARGGPAGMDVGRTPGYVI